MIPLHVRWMLVFVNPIDRSVSLCRATPRSWLAAGEKGIVVRNAPLGQRRLSFAVASRLGESPPTVSANISLSDPGGGSSLPAAPPLSITLRVPLGFSLVSVTVGGKALPASAIDAPAGTVQLPAAATAAGQLALAATYRKPDGAG